MTKLVTSLSATVFITAALLSAPSGTHAAVAPDHLSHRAELEVASHVIKPRVARSMTSVSPILARRAPVGHLATGAWKTMWDRDTGVAAAIYGSGVSVVGSATNPDVAEAFARVFLAEQLDLLAPGAHVTDFELVSNHFSSADGVRTVGFVQRHDGLLVVGGQIALRFKNDRLVAVTSQALPKVVVSEGPGLSRADASLAALQWIDADFDSVSELVDVSDPVILPIVSSAGRISYHRVTPVTVSSADPIGKWTTYISMDSSAGATPIARKQLLKFATGTVNYNVPTRWPGGTFADFPATDTSFTVDGVAQTSSAAGVVTFDNATAQVVTSVTGDFVRVLNQSGGEGSANFTIADGGSITWSAADSEILDAQLATFIHANIAKERARILNPGLAWLNNRMTANVNINQSCNAFADGDTINMFRASNQCQNTGRLADVVYHEFGHNLHGNSIIPGAGSFDGAFSEGLSDYYAGSITDDPAMGLGFFNNTQALRHMDQRDFVWPDDIGQIHTTGRIFATAMWDLRKALVAKMGQVDGAAYADRLFYAAVQRSSDIPGTTLEILVADDDDGNLANGTPNQCEIEEVFEAHGLPADTGGAAPGLGFPLHDGYSIAVPIAETFSACNPPAVTGVELSWRIRGENSDRETIPMTLSGDQYVAEIPKQAPGQVIHYRVKASYDNGRDNTLPKNPAAPYYEFFDGVTTDLYCTDFSADPGGEWTLSGSNNIWQWGTPGGATGGPDSPYAGTNVFATGLDSGYAPSSNFSAETPVIDTTGHETVRLQYRRWLGVEDSTYDKAQISVNGAVLWENAKNAAGNLAHEDREWRFHDVDISAQAASGSVAVKFGLISDQGLEFAGWAIDQVCVVSTTAAPICGDGELTEGEQCDDGNNVDDDDCSNLCVLPEDGGGCGCQSSGGGGSGAILLLLALVFGYVRRNRKRVTG